MKTNKLATIFMVGALIALLVTLGNFQSSFAGGHSGARVTKNAGPPSTGDSVGGSANPSVGNPGGHPWHKYPCPAGAICATPDNASKTLNQFQGD